MKQYVKSPVLGHMMDQPLLISGIIRHADRFFGEVEIVSKLDDGIHRYTYRDLHRRARQLASALTRRGLQLGDRVATLGWNSYRHLEAYFAIPGAGMVLHTVNPRLHIDQIAYIAQHAEDKYVFFDLSFLPQAEAIAAQCSAPQGFVVLCDRADMPSSTSINNLICYEEFLQEGSVDYEWPMFDEHSASGLCYTSGTTGDPKGALYSHRSTVLHTYAEVMPDAFDISSRDVMMPIVPMYHVNAWGFPYSGALVGAKIVLPGSKMDGASLYELIEQEEVTFSAGVPTIWVGVFAHMESRDLKFSSLQRVDIGGSACPPALLRTFLNVYGVEPIHAWGMTETSPLGTICSLRRKHLSLPEEDQIKLRQTQGHPVFGLDVKIVDDMGNELVWDGLTRGDLLVKGSWVIRSYFKDAGGDVLRDGWLPTGDIATINSDGFVQIVDRSKDLIKSGGEWISSIDLENIAMAHTDVSLAVCIAVPHPKWDERPLLVVVKKEGSKLDREALLEFYDGKIAKWWTPDDVLFVESIALGATGKILKNKLRDELKSYVLPTV